MYGSTLELLRGILGVSTTIRSGVTLLLYHEPDFLKMGHTGLGLRVFNKNLVGPKRVLFKIV